LYLENVELCKDMGGLNPNLIRTTHATLLPAYDRFQLGVHPMSDTYVQRFQDVLNQQVAPIEEGMMPSDIIGVNDQRVWYSMMKELSESRLPVPATTIYSQNPRSIMRCIPRIENETNKVAN
jgi:hypothetical protein